MSDPAAVSHDHPDAVRSPSVGRRLRLAGILITFGLVVELITLGWASPSSFLVFAMVGGTAIAVGILLYLLTIAS